MKQLIIASIIAVLLTGKSEAQDFKLLWRISPSFWNIYEVEIYKSKSRHKIKISAPYLKDSVECNLKKDDVLSLYGFFKNYTFEKSIGLGTQRIYHDFDYLPSDTIVTFNGDSLYKFNNYTCFYDNKAKRYYTEKHYSYTDGTDFEGFYEEDEIKKRIQYYSGTMNSLDKELSKTMYNLMLKYSIDKEINDGIVELEKFIDK